MYQSILAVPIPSGLPQGICRLCQSWGGALANFAWSGGQACPPRGRDQIYPNITKLGGFFWEHKPTSKLLIYQGCEKVVESF